MAQYLGIIDIVWRGVNLDVAKGAKFRLGGIKNNTVVTGRRVGRAQEFAETTASATVHLRRGQSWSDIYTEAEGELQLKCDTGQTYVIADAFLTGDIPELTGGEGGAAELNWAGGEAQEIITS